VVAGIFAYAWPLPLTREGVQAAQDNPGDPPPGSAFIGPPIGWPNIRVRGVSGDRLRVVDGDREAEGDGDVVVAGAVSGGATTTATITTTATNNKRKSSDDGVMAGLQVRCSMDAVIHALPLDVLLCAFSHLILLYWRFQCRRAWKQYRSHASVLSM
jgi:hypothetical protein